MKYTLDEKFVLNEGFKLEERFILNERFVLTEDAANINDTINKAITALNIDKITKVIDGINAFNEKNDKIEQALNVREEAENRKTAEYALEHNLSWEDTKNKCNAYINKLKAILKNLGIKLENLEVLQDNINKFNSTVNGPTDDAETKKAKAKPIFEKILEQADAITNISDVALKLPRELLTKLATFEKDTENGKLIIDDITSLKNELIKYTSDGEYNKVLNADALNMLLTNKDGANINSVIDAAESLPETVDEKNLSETIDKLTKITAANDKESQAKIIISNLSTAKNKVSNASTRAKATIDSYWDSRYQQAGNDTTKKQNFWNDYWANAWGANTEKIKRLGEAFTQELIKLSFGETLNPFLTFIKNNIIGGKKLNIDNQHYAIIHNAYVKKKIDDADLRLSPEQIKNSANVIFCQSLYTKSVTDMEKYIDLQNNIIKNFKAGKIEDPNIQAMYQEATDHANINKLLKAMMYSGGDAETGRPGGEELRDIKEIETDISLIFGESSKVNYKDEKEDFNISKINFNNKQDYVQAILFLKNRFASSSTINQINNIISSNEILNGSKTDDRYTEPLIKFFDSIDVNDNNIIKIIEDLIKKGELQNTGAGK